jgi:hypothetical protein
VAAGQRACGSSNISSASQQLDAAFEGGIHKLGELESRISIAREILEREEAVTTSTRMSVDCAARGGVRLSEKLNARNR